MSDGVTFEDEPIEQVGNIRIVPGAPTGILAWLVKSKMAKNGKQAEWILVIVVILCVIGSIVFFIIANPHTAPAPTPLTPGWPKAINQK